MGTVPSDAVAADDRQMTLATGISQMETALIGVRGVLGGAAGRVPEVPPLDAGAELTADDLEERRRYTVLRAGIALILDLVAATEQQAAAR